MADASCLAASASGSGRMSPMVHAAGVASIEYPAGQWPRCIWVSLATCDNMCTVYEYGACQPKARYILAATN